MVVGDAEDYDGFGEGETKGSPLSAENVEGAGRFKNPKVVRISDATERQKEQYKILTGKEPPVVEYEGPGSEGGVKPEPAGKKVPEGKIKTELNYAIKNAPEGALGTYEDGTPKKAKKLEKVGNDWWIYWDNEKKQKLSQSEMDQLLQEYGVKP